MARMNIIQECLKMIENCYEMDCECYGVGYYLSFKDGQIHFSRVTTTPTGEYYSDGGIDTKSHKSSMCSWDATVEDYCNLAIAMQDRENLKYGYGEDIDMILFTPIF